MEPLSRIIESICPCGGDPTGPQHEESLLHRQWLLGQGLRNHDPLADDDRRQLREAFPLPDTTGYSIPRTPPETRQLTRLDLSSRVRPYPPDRR